MIKVTETKKTKTNITKYRHWLHLTQPESKYKLGLLFLLIPFVLTIDISNHKSATHTESQLLLLVLSTFGIYTLAKKRRAFTLESTL